MTRWLCAAVIACGAAGCDRVFGITDPSTDAAVDASSPPVIDGVPGPDARIECSGWGMPEALVGLTGGNLFDPSLRADELEIYYVRDVDPIGTDFDLFRRTRTTTAANFGSEQPVDVNTSSNETDPALSADGFILMYKSNRSGLRIWELRRKDLDMAFVGTPVNPIGLAGQPINEGFDLSGDALTIYFDDLNNLVRTTRASPTSAFGLPPELYAARARWPTVAASEREVFHNATGTGILTRTRSEPNDPFGSDSTFDAQGKDADLSADDETIVYNDGSGLVIRRRVCP